MLLTRVLIIDRSQLNCKMAESQEGRFDGVLLGIAQQHTEGITEVRSGVGLPGWWALIGGAPSAIAPRHVLQFSQEKN